MTDKDHTAREEWRFVRIARTHGSCPSHDGKLTCGLSPQHVTCKVLNINRTACGSHQNSHLVPSFFGEPTGKEHQNTRTHFNDCTTRTRARSRAPRETSSIVEESSRILHMLNQRVLTGATSAVQEGSAPSWQTNRSFHSK